MIACAELTNSPVIVSGAQAGVAKYTKSHSGNPLSRAASHARIMGFCSRAEE